MTVTRRNQTGELHGPGTGISGGQWAAHTGAAGDLDVDLDAPTSRHPELAHHGETRWDEDPDRMYETATRMVRSRASGAGGWSGVDPMNDQEDHIQDAAIAEWMTEAKKGRDGVANPGGLMSMVGRAKIYAPWQPNNRPEDRRAWKMLDAWIADYQNTHGHAPSQAEIAERGKEMRDNWTNLEGVKVRHKPAPEFWKRRPDSDRRTQEPLPEGDRLAGEYASVLSYQPNEDDAFEVESWSAMAVHLSSLANVKDVDVRKARRAVDMVSCAAVCEQVGAPTPRVGAVSTPMVRRARGAVVDAPGGVGRLCEAWERGEDHDDLEYLWVPFAAEVARGKDQTVRCEGLSVDEKDQIVHALTIREGGAEQLWLSAASMSDRGNRQKLIGFRSMYLEEVADGQ